MKYILVINFPGCLTDKKNERNKQKYRRKLHDEITTLSGSLRTKRLNGDLEIGHIYKDTTSCNDTYNIYKDIKRFRFDR